jgi:hypothetical protein
MKFSMLGTGYCVDDPALRVTGQPGWYSSDNGGRPAFYMFQYA